MDAISIWALICAGVGTVGILVSWINMQRAIRRIYAACEPKQEPPC